jgi:hypothetical protein
VDVLDAAILQGLYDRDFQLRISRRLSLLTPQIAKTSFYLLVLKKTQAILSSTDISA